MYTLTPQALESVLARAADAALVVGESGAILFANSLAHALFKYSPGELDGQNLELLVPHRSRTTHVGHRIRFTDDRGARPMGSGLDLFALCKDGSEERVDISLIPMRRGLENLVIATIQLRPSASTAPLAN